MKLKERGRQGNSVEDIVKMSSLFTLLVSPSLQKIFFGFYFCVSGCWNSSLPTSFSSGKLNEERTRTFFSSSSFFSTHLESGPARPLHFGLLAETAFGDGYGRENRDEKEGQLSLPFLFFSHLAPEEEASENFAKRRRTTYTSACA